jgi:hypothetical protein
LPDCRSLLCYADLKSLAAKLCAGSIPAPGTNLKSLQEKHSEGFLNCEGRGAAPYAFLFIFIICKICGCPVEWRFATLLKVIRGPVFALTSRTKPSLSKPLDINGNFLLLAPGLIIR